MCFLKYIFQYFKQKYGSLLGLIFPTLSRDKKVVLRNSLNLLCDLHLAAGITSNIYNHDAIWQFRYTLIDKMHDTKNETLTTQ